MSYKRTFRRQVAVRYSGSVSYPASQHGGSVSYSGTAYEDVDVVINVDTMPFDAGVQQCNASVNGLTASVGVMNAAQCKAIADNSEKVSQSIIDGFFHTVRTEISTQKTELQQVIDARLMLLRQQEATLIEKRKNMEQDYARTTQRYQKIFDDLNNELAIRIHEVDQPVFDFVKNVDTHSDRMLHTDMVQTVATLSKESSAIQSQVGVATVKNHTLQAMEQAQNFLAMKALSERTMQDAMTNGSGTDRYLVPVCFMETASERQQRTRQCVMPEKYVEQSKGITDDLCQLLADTDLGQTSEKEKEQLQSYVQAEIAQHVTGDDTHAARVRAMINKLFNQ